MSIELLRISENDDENVSFIMEKGIEYFFIIKNGIRAGIYAVIKITDDMCEVALTIFKKSRYKVISRNSICFLIDFPFSLGFKKVITWSKMNTWINLLNKFEYYGIYKIDNPAYDLDSNKIWFGKEIGFKNV